MIRVLNNSSTKTLTARAWTAIVATRRTAFFWPIECGPERRAGRRGGGVLSGPAGRAGTGGRGGPATTPPLPAILPGRVLGGQAGFRWRDIGRFGGRPAASPFRRRRAAQPAHELRQAAQP